MIKVRLHIFIALLYFAFAALVGLVLRFSFITSIDWNYKFLLHTHSHVALLGWGYTAVTTLFYYLFLQKEGENKKFKQLFYFTQFTILGMMFSFPFQGYALVSIMFSTLFLFASYRFVFLFLKYVPLKVREKPAFVLAKWSLYFLVFSSLGPFALGVIIKTLGSTSALYHNAIYFYLHFLYNGFFILALLSVFFYLLEKYGFSLSHKKFSIFNRCLITSVVLSFLLSVLWINPSPIFYWLAATGAFLQIIAFLILISFVKKIWLELKKKLSTITIQMFRVVSIILILKIVVQMASAFPAVAEFVAQSRTLIIGYLHLVFLGLISISIFAFLQVLGLLKTNKIALGLYGLGFVFSEFILFYQGLFYKVNLRAIANYPMLLLVSSSLMFFGVVIVLFNSKSTNPKLKNH